MDREYAVSEFKVALPENPHLSELERAGVDCFAQIRCVFEAHRLLLSGELIRVEMAEFNNCKSYAITFKGGFGVEFDITDGEFMIVQNNGCEFSFATDTIVVGPPRSYGGAT